MADLNAPYLDAPVVQAAQNRTDLTNLFTGQRGDINTFNTGFSDFVRNLPSSDSLATRIGGELNLPTLRANANTINTEFANLPSTYRDATRGFDVNNNQLSRIIGQKATDIAPAMTTANNALAVGENALTARMGYAQNDINRSLLPWQSQQTLLNDRLAREATGFTTEMGQQLNALIAKMNAGVTLTTDEQDNANRLAVAEKQYQAAIDAAKINTKYIPVNGLGAINTQTGAFLSPGSGGWSF